MRPASRLLYYYPNNQDAALLWYHDHTMGINRLNIFAGLLGLYIVRDPLEESLNLPRGKYEIPLVLYDRTFDPDGQLNYPVSPVPGEPWVPEFFGNAVLVNGKLLPYLEVEARKYRFRILNARQWQVLSFVAFERPGVSPDRDRSGAARARPSRSKQLSLAPGERATRLWISAVRPALQIVVNNDMLRPVMQLRVAARRVARDQFAA